MWLFHSFKRDLNQPLFPSYFHGKFPNISENLFSMYHQPRKQCSCGKNPKISHYFEKSLKVIA